MLKISVTEVCCSAMFIIQWNMHSALHFLLSLAGTQAHIRQVGRAALPVTVCTYQATAELEYGADVTAPSLTGSVPGPLWPVHSLTAHPSSLPICGRSAGVWLSRLSKFWRYKLDIAHKYSLGLGIWHMFKPFCRCGKNTFKTHTQNLYRLKKITPKTPLCFLCERRRLCPLLNGELRSWHVCAKLSYRDLIEWCPQVMLHV